MCMPIAWNALVSMLGLTPRMIRNQRKFLQRVDYLFLPAMNPLVGHTFSMRTCTSATRQVAYLLPITKQCHEPLAGCIKTSRAVLHGA